MKSISGSGRIAIRRARVEDSEAFARLQTGNLCRVTALVVAREFHGEGFGRELMAKAEQYARANRCIKIEITSGEHRTRAHDFYRELGYEEVSKRFLKSLCGEPGSGGGTEARYHRRFMQ